MHDSQYSSTLAETHRQHALWAEPDYEPSSREEGLRPPARLVRHGVADEFYQVVKKELPGLENDRSHWRLLGHLIFTSWREGERRLPVVTSRLLAEIEGKGKQWEHNNYNAGDFLDRFSHEVHPFKYSGWSWREERGRVVTDLEWPDRVQAAIDRELVSSGSGQKRVYLEDGRAVTRARLRQVREDERAYPLKLSESAACPLAKRLLHYLNSQPPRRFLSLLNDFPAVHAAALNINDPLARAQQVRVLHNIRDSPQPFYKPTRATVRVFPVSENLLGLRKDLRRRLTQDWYEADLACAQLAICAAEWEVREVQDLLLAGADPWHHLAASLGVRLDEQVKAALKRGIYGLSFGMRECNMRVQLEKNFACEERASSFLAVPLVRALLQGREQRFAQIEADQGARDCFDRWLPLGKEVLAEQSPLWRGGKPKLVTAPGTFNRRSILAQLAQAKELMLLAPVIDLALAHPGTHGFTITLWMHDGFSFVPHASRDGAHWENRLIEAVDQQARRMGIATGLKIAGPRNEENEKKN
jgi:hypothetical protein